MLTSAARALGQMRPFLVLVFLAVQNAQGTLYMEDAITNATVGSNLGPAAPWGASSSQVKVASGNLTYSTLLAPTPTGNMASIAGSGGGSSYRAFASSAVSSGTVLLVPAAMHLVAEQRR